MGPRRAGAREVPRPADLPLDRLRGLPLVPRHGARVVRERGHGPLPQRPLRLRQGRPRGAARPRPDLHGRRPGDDRRRRLADVGLPDARRATRSTAAPTTPTQPRHGMPSFRQVLEGVERAWREQRAEVDRGGRATRGRAGRAATGRGRTPTHRPRPCSTRRDATLVASFDARNGSWGGAPKFPQPMTIEYLLRRHGAAAIRGPRPSRGSRSRRWPTAASTTSSAAASIATPRIRRWLVPHFEQMLYDNAQLARVYLHAWARTGDARFRAVAVEVARLPVARARRCPTAPSPSSQDADTDGVEGLTFVWTAAEIRELLGDDAEPFMAAYGVTDEGNWEDRNILSRVWPDAADAAAVAGGRRVRAAARRRPRAPARATGERGPSRRATTRRLRPGTGWRSAALADAGRLLGEARYTERGRSRRRGHHGRAAGRRRRARPLVEGRSRDRPGGPRGLRRSRRGPPGAVRGHVRRALVHDGAQR